MIPALPEPDFVLDSGTTPCFYAGTLLQYARDYHAAQIGEPVAFKCGSYFYPYPSEDAYCDMAEKHVLLYALKADLSDLDSLAGIQGVGL